MIFPSKSLIKLTKSIEKLKQIENSRSEREKELISEYENGLISIKEINKKLKKEKLFNASKKTDLEAVTTFIEYTNILNELSISLNVKRTPRYILKKVSIFNKLFGSSKTKHKKIKISKKPSTVVNTEEKISKQKKKHKSIFAGLFKSKKINNEKSENKIDGPDFETPKILLPENYQVLIPNFAYAFIKEENNKKKYIVAEPELTEKETKILEKTKKSLINKISLADLADENSMYNSINKIFNKEKISLKKEQKANIVYYIIRQISGLDRIEPLMHDNLIEDIECDGIGIPIFIVHRKYGHIETNIQFDTDEELQQFVIKMAHLCKSYVSYASPLLDSILPDGSRVNATLTSNVSTRGPTFTIRKFPQNPLTVIDLVNSGTVTPLIISYLWFTLQFKKNILIIGPTAGGKTTLLNAISSFIPVAERVVSIEDTREINLLLDNWIPQVSRPGFGPPDSNGKKYGEVTMGDLLKESFRQRPDYLIIGEVRGEEMSLMFQGMASGHCSLSTVHSKSVNDLVTRLTTPPISLDPSLLTSLNIIVITGFKGSNETLREIKEIDEIRGYNIEKHKIEYNALYKSTDKTQEKNATASSDLFTKNISMLYKSDMLKEISIEHNFKMEKISEVINKRKDFIENLSKNPPKDYVEFAQKLKDFYKQEKI